MDAGAVGDNEPGRGPELHPYPASERPEQPAPGPASRWPWVISGLVLTVVVAGGLLLLVLYPIGSNAG